MSDSATTTDHNVIKKWAEERELFRKFDESDLAFLYQDRTRDGKLSRFHKFVRRFGE